MPGNKKHSKSLEKKYRFIYLTLGLENKGELHFVIIRGFTLVAHESSPSPLLRKSLFINCLLSCIIYPLSLIIRWHTRILLSFFYKN